MVPLHQPNFSPERGSIGLCLIAQQYVTLVDGPIGHSPPKEIRRPQAMRRPNNLCDQLGQMALFIILGNLFTPALRITIPELAHGLTHLFDDGIE